MNLFSSIERWSNALVQGLLLLTGYGFSLMTVAKNGPDKHVQVQRAHDQPVASRGRVTKVRTRKHPTHPLTHRPLFPDIFG